MSAEEVLGRAAAGCLGCGLASGRAQAPEARPSGRDRAAGFPFAGPPPLHTFLAVFYFSFIAISYFSLTGVTRACAPPRPQFALGWTCVKGGPRAGRTPSLSWVPPKTVFTPKTAFTQKTAPRVYSALSVRSGWGCGAGVRTCTRLVRVFV